MALLRAEAVSATQWAVSARPVVWEKKLKSEKGRFGGWRDTQALTQTAHTFEPIHTNMSSQLITDMIAKAFGGLRAQLTADLVTLFDESGVKTTPKMVKLLEAKEERETKRKAAAAKAAVKRAETKAKKAAEAAPEAASDEEAPEAASDEAPEEAPEAAPEEAPEEAPEAASDEAPPAKAEKAVKPPKAEKAEKAVKPPKAEKAEKAEKAPKAEKAEKAVKAEKAPKAPKAPKTPEPTAKAKAPAPPAKPTKAPAPSELTPVQINGTWVLKDDEGRCWAMDDEGEKGEWAGLYKDGVLVSAPEPEEED